MEKSRNSFTYYAATIFFITVIICGCHIITMSVQPTYPSPTLLSPSFVPYCVLMTGVFLCSLVLQGEDILKIYRRRKSLFIRVELIILGIIAFLLGYLKFWFLLLFPPATLDQLGIFAVFITTDLVLEIAYMFAAGIFFVRAFYVQDTLLEKKERITYLIMSASAIILIVVIYIICVLFTHFFWAHFYAYIDIFIAIVPVVVVFSCVLVLQGEDILNIYRQRKSLFIRRELIILGIIAILLNKGAIWSHSLHFELADSGLSYSSFLYVVCDSIIQNAALSTVYLYAAGIFFVRAFHTKAKDNEQLVLNDTVDMNS